MASEAKMVSLIPVRNMSRAIKFYKKALGGKLRDRGRGPMRDFWASLSVGGAEVWFVAPEEREKRKLAYHTFLVKDIKRYVAKLKKRGVKFEKAEPMGKDSRIEGPIAFERYGASAMFKDSEGNLLMAWQNAVPM
ncbi:MAG: VOC family protein [Thermoplasmata archaeon]|nr:VOC family protein [Thermoplasmata archaeon]